MAGFKKVEVDKERLAAYIQELEKLYKENYWDSTNLNKVEGLGNTVKMLQVVEDNYAEMTKSVLDLIKTFSGVMKNALDGEIETDKKNAEMIDNF